MDSLSHSIRVVGKWRDQALLTPLPISFSVEDSYEAPILHLLCSLLRNWE